MWNDCNCMVVGTFFGIAFFGIWMKTDLFQSCGHCWVFQISWYIECSTLIAPSLDLFVVMLPKIHLTSHTKMSSSRWVITPSWLSRSLRPFLSISSVCCCHFSSSLLLQSGPYHFCPFIVSILAWNVPLISPVFLKRSLVFTVLLFSSYFFVLFI